MAAACPQGPAWQTALQLSNDVTPWLKEPVDVYLMVLNQREGDPAPAFLRVKVTLDWMNETLSRTAFCSAAGLHTARALDKPDYVDEGKKHLGAQWQIEVDGAAFRFVYPLTHSTVYATFWLENADLVKSIVALRSNKLEELCAMGTHGGCLFHCGDNDPFDFIEDVLEKVPSVGARQTAIDMSKAILLTGDSCAPQAPEMSKRRLGL